MRVTSMSLPSSPRIERVYRRSTVRGKASEGSGHHTQRGQVSSSFDDDGSTAEAPRQLRVTKRNDEVYERTVTDRDTSRGARTRSGP
jgi:hypothetical protein